MSSSNLLPSAWRTGTRSSAPERMYTSDSSASRYCGSPLSVLRVIAGRERFQPRPKGPLPAPESYESESCGPKPERPGLVAMGTVMEPVPVTWLAPNFSPMPRIAPPPFGREMEGTLIWLLPDLFFSSWFEVPVVLASTGWSFASLYRLKGAYEVSLVEGYLIRSTGGGTLSIPSGCLPFAGV